MKLLIMPVVEYNKKVKQLYPFDWSGFNKTKGVVATDENFDKATWGITQESAINKFMGFTNKF